MPQKQKGFSLIEVSIGVAIAGLLLSAAISAAKPTLQQRTLNTTKENLNTIHTALQLHLHEKGHYPCPAGLKEPASSPQHGMAQCSTSSTKGVWQAGKIVIGAVPGRTLGLPDKTIRDGWGRMLFYAVVETMTSASTFNAANGIIDVRSLNETSLLGNPGKGWFIVYSAGVKGVGAYDSFGKQFAPCNNAYSDKDEENCAMKKPSSSSKPNIFYKDQISLVPGAQFHDDFLVFSENANIGLQETCPAGQILVGFNPDDTNREDERNVLITYTPGTTGVITATASPGGPVFVAGDVGKYIVYKSDTGYESGRFRIDAYNSALSVKVSVVQQPSSNTYQRWYLSSPNTRLICQKPPTCSGSCTSGKLVGFNADGTPKCQ